jgi:hypothetical protein
MFWFGLILGFAVGIAFYKFAGPWIEARFTDED